MWQKRENHVWRIYSRASFQTLLTGVDKTGFEVLCLPSLMGILLRNHFYPAAWMPLEIWFDMQRMKTWHQSRESNVSEPVLSPEITIQLKGLWTWQGWCQMGLMGHLWGLQRTVRKGKKYLRRHLWIHNTLNLEADGLQQHWLPLLSAKNRNLRLQFTRAHQN